MLPSSLLYFCSHIRKTIFCINPLLFMALCRDLQENTWTESDWPLCCKKQDWDVCLLCFTKDGLITESFSPWSNTYKKKVPNHYPHKEKMLGVVIWQHFWRFEPIPLKNIEIVLGLCNLNYLKKNCICKFNLEKQQNTCWVIYIF